ncbi:MAG: ferrous iron transport protein B [Lachnospiraceae bacterium]|nr:ferrous iron transport protein B [Lachnospiraceae bacterium]
MNLRELKPGDYAVVKTVGGDGALRQHILDMGLIPGVKTCVVKYAPMGDPVEIRIHDYYLTLRLADAEKIGVDKISEGEEPKKSERHLTDIAHPGFGEDGKFAPKPSGEVLGDAQKITFALVGNQNSGKTTLFNELTGANQHVGNFPGVTVDRKDGAIRGYKNALITDLPGIYSMSPYSKEEIVSRNHVLEEKPKAIINIIDATNIERNLYLTMQLLEMEVPMVIALNMMDELRSGGGTVDINRMESMLGVPVVPISAAKNEGIDELMQHAMHVAKYQERPGRADFCDENDNGGSVHRGIHMAMHLIEDHALLAGLPLRFAASKAIEGDSLIIDALKLDGNERETLEHIAKQMETERGLDRSAAIADMRYSFIFKVCKMCVRKPDETLRRSRNERIDKILTGKYTALPMFIAVMAAIFFLTFNVIGAWLQELLDMGIGYVTDRVDAALTDAYVNENIHALIVSGMLEGVGSVLSFLPVIVTMFFFLSILEDSGYIARVAFFMDKLLRKIGLSGRSIVPLLIGFGCTVPAVMATRTLPSNRDRRMTILLTPFMSCTAKLPIYAFFVDAFFPAYGWLIITGLYFLGIVFGIVAALIYKKTIFSGEAVPFVMELPNYRLPMLKNVAHLLWDKAKDFLQRAFSVILVATVVVWVLNSFDFGLNRVSEEGESMLACIAGVVAPLFTPVGLGDWRIVTSLISGFMAKESVVSVMSVLFETGGGVAGVLTEGVAACVLVFSLLYTPCVAAVAAIRREMGGKWALIVVIWQCAVAYLAALLVRCIGLLVGVV